MSGDANIGYQPDAAEDLIVSAVSEALTSAAAPVLAGQAGSWTLSFSGPEKLEGTARIEHAWLVIESPMPEGGLPAEIEGAQMWTYLERSCALPSYMKYVLDDGKLVLRADLPLHGMPVHLITQRTIEICSAFSAVLQNSAPPILDGGAENTDVQNLGTQTSLSELCADAGWDCFARSDDKVQVALAPNGPHATVERTSGRIVIQADLAVAEPDPSDGVRHYAVGLLLLRTSAVVRLVRAIAWGSCAPHRAKFEVILGGAPHLEELAHALAALSLACDIAAREVVAVATYTKLASAYMKTKLSGPVENPI